MSEPNTFSPDSQCGQAAAYALGALEDSEARAFRRHLDECAVCQDELQALETVVAVLPMAAPQHRAPKSLRRSIIQAIRQEAKPRSRYRRQGAPGRARVSRRGFAWRAAAGVAVLAAIAITTILLSSGATPVRLISARVLAARGQAQVQVSGGHGELIVRRMVPPSPGHVYEIWLQRPHHPPAPANALFSVGVSGDATVGLQRSVRGASRLLVTEEPDGGSTTPTSSPVIVASLT